MLKIPYAGCLGLSTAISMQFTLKMCVASRNRKKKIAKNPFIGVQGRSRSSMLINLKSPSPAPVMRGSVSVPICNCFHTKQANSGKITCFKGYPSLTLSFEWNPLTLEYEIMSQKN